MYAAAAVRLPGSATSTQNVPGVTSPATCASVPGVAGVADAPGSGTQPEPPGRPMDRFMGTGATVNVTLTTPVTVTVKFFESLLFTATVPENVSVVMPFVVDGLVLDDELLPHAETSSASVSVSGAKRQGSSRHEWVTEMM